jgi:DHA2 family multidrug resistance protein
MSRLNLEVSAGRVIWPRIVQVLGAGMMFVPINTIAYRFIARTQTSNASGLFSLIRNEGSSIGVALVTTLLVRHTQVHQYNLVSHINALNPIATDMLQQLRAGLGPSDPTNGAAALGVMNQIVQRQAGVLAYMDLFQMFAWATLLVVPLVFFMRKGAATQEAMAAH